MYGADTFPESQMSGSTLPLWLIVSLFAAAVVIGIGQRAITELSDSSSEVEA
jgi:hypothetical protein